MSKNRQLDVKVAQLLDMDVLGDIPCRYDCETDTWLPSWTIDPGDGYHPVVLGSCFCKFAEDDDIRYFGHVAGCLEVVPFYHQDANLAIAALEQACEKYGRTPKIERVTRWHVRLWRGRECVYGEDKSLPLAIVKALAELESEK